GLAYWHAGGQLNAARQARRNDSYSEAETRLGDCWRLPGFGRALDLEWELLGVQQGDLRSEPALATRLASRGPDYDLMLEALAKGNLAVFRFNEARTYAEALLQARPNDPPALSLRGRAWLKLQQEDKGLSDLAQAIEGEPTSVQIRLSLADA